MSAYVQACCTEIARAQMPAASSVFFGGGTPSLLPGGELGAIVEAIAKRPNIKYAEGSGITEAEGVTEITVECNPDTASPELFDAYVACGVNRLSIGVQSMVPHVLASLGRTHDPANVASAVRFAAEAGIERVSVDIIYGASGESISDWKTTVEAVLALEPQPEHISAYGLTVEPGTPLALDPARYPDDDDQADKYIVADRLFRDAGLINYEISNWARPGQQCRHNLVYWGQGNYRGIGCAAHSHEAGRRWWNMRTPERYISAIENARSPVGGQEVLDEPTRRFEGLELLLRTSEGVPSDSVGIEDREDLHEFVDVADGDRIVLNLRGRLMANEIALRLR